MLKPSYAELMEVLNKDTEEVSEITSRYTIVIAAAKRARQLIAGDEPMVKEKQGKPLSTAVEEIRQEKVKVVPEGQGTVLNLKKAFSDEEYLEMNQEFARKDNEIFGEREDDSELDIFSETDDEGSDDLTEDDLEISDNDFDDDYDDIMSEETFGKEELE
ncbi:MAG: DNA-directed RNA polymerase subunit omega [Clostridiales bacterium]|nr:DNA-directed RNA polymerase subunit omega [Clostridiales bacterium]